MASVVITLVDFVDEDGKGGVEMDLRSELHGAPPHEQFASDAVVSSIALARLWNGGQFDKLVEKICPDIIELRANEDFMSGLLSVEETDVPPPLVMSS